MNKKIFKAWLPLGITITALCGLLYITVQQNYRLSANDPQIQIAEDIAMQLTQGQNPQYFMPQSKPELRKSLAAFLLIFNDKGRLLGSSITLDGKDPIVPQQIFANIKQKGEVRFTWQPKSGIRNAVVANYYKGQNTSGYVLVGKSLKEIEARIDSLGIMVFLGWLITLFASFTPALIAQKFKL
jgi:hypothetical protein